METSRFDGTAEQRAGHAVVTAGAVRVAVVSRREAAPTRYALGHHPALLTPTESRLGLVVRLDELGADHENADGRLYVRDPDGFVIEFLFE
ncbi:MAG: hypothetical protein H5U40_07445 [Polyangiaceae bacterium]|nr:hypothetical protein [Polyangiaceae bacterium]